MKENRFDIYFDGSCHNKEGKNAMGLGIWIERYEKDEKGEFQKVKFLEKALFGGNGTNNIAEWKAFTEAMKLSFVCKKLNKYAEIYFYSDSQLIVRQFSGQYQIKDPNFAYYYEDAHNGLSILNDEFKSFKGLFWIGREFNTHADRLSKLGRIK